MINPIYALAYNNRGYVYEAQGKKDDAIADFQIALLLDPSLIGAKDGLKRLGAPPAMVEESERRVREGKALVEQNCAICHATGAKGASPNKKAPEFRNLHARHAILALREPLSRGIAAPHDEMPKFALTAAQIDTIVAYINSLTPTPTKPAAAGKRAVVPIATPRNSATRARGASTRRKRARNATPCCAGRRLRPIPRRPRSSRRQHARNERARPHGVAAHFASDHAEPDHRAQRSGRRRRLYREPAGEKEEATGALAFFMQPWLSCRSPPLGGGAISRGRKMRPDTPSPDVDPRDAWRRIRHPRHLRPRIGLRGSAAAGPLHGPYRVVVRPRRRFRCLAVGQPVVDRGGDGAGGNVVRMGIGGQSRLATRG